MSDKKSYTEADLKKAFFDGFSHSGEGYNGEILDGDGKSPEDDPDLRIKFEECREQVNKIKDKVTIEFPAEYFRGLDPPCYIAICTTFEVHTQGEDLEDARRMLAEALKLFLVSFYEHRYRESGEKLPCSVCQKPYTHYCDKREVFLCDNCR